ncbi:hypothetical protein [Rufibacter tibetensis]|uniref:Uncharacterized protein n=1 Tax=Rufibacter tibetensis TaxID=512763 RepID=A0A0P0CIH6_9BACT|nr:hypothetical protein [Rufibacter tibetensis]ALI99167.1 hypothetical protein DC20_09495 [Rufibacter tibetensis]
MPQGVVKSVIPTFNKPCAGTVEALEDNDVICIKRGQTYNFKEGHGNCCKKDNIVEIIGKNIDGTVNLDCKE